ARWMPTASLDARGTGVAASRAGGPVMSRQLRRWATARFSAVLTLAAAACLIESAAAQPVPPRRPPPEPGYQVVRLPSQAGNSKGTNSALTTPELELVTVALPRGTALEAQDSPTPLTMQAIFGTGTVKIGSHDERLTQNRMIYVARDVPYSVVP